MHCLHMLADGYACGLDACTVLRLSSTLGTFTACSQAVPQQATKDSHQHRRLRLLLAADLLQAVTTFGNAASRWQQLRLLAPGPGQHPNQQQQKPHAGGALAIQQASSFWLEAFHILQPLMISVFGMLCGVNAAALQAIVQQSAILEMLPQLLVAALRSRMPTFIPLSTRVKWWEGAVAVGWLLILHVWNQLHKCGSIGQVPPAWSEAHVQALLQLAQLLAALGTAVLHQGRGGLSGVLAEPYIADGYTRTTSSTTGTAGSTSSNSSSSASHTATSSNAGSTSAHAAAAHPKQRQWQQQQLAVPAMHEGLLRDVPDWKVMLQQPGITQSTAGPLQKLGEAHNMKGNPCLLVKTVEVASTVLQHLMTQHVGAVSEYHTACVALVQLAAEVAVLRDVPHADLDSFQAAVHAMHYAAEGLHLLPPRPTSAAAQSPAASSSTASRITASRRVASSPASLSSVAATAHAVPCALYFSLDKLQPAQAAAMLRPVLHLLSATVWQLMELPGRVKLPEDLPCPPHALPGMPAAIYSALAAAVVLPGKPLGHRHGVM